MNEQLTKPDFPGDTAKPAINPALLSMQIHALQESIQRLIDKDGVLVEFPGSEQNDMPVKPEC